MRLRAAAVVLVLGLSAFAGCARAPRAPQRAGESCEADADCNREGASADASTCGYLRLCVAGRCELDAGVGSRPIVCD